MGEPYNERWDSRDDPEIWINTEHWYDVYRLLVLFMQKNNIMENMNLVFVYFIKVYSKSSWRKTNIE